MTYFVSRKSLPGLAGNDPGHFFVEVAIAVDCFNTGRIPGCFDRNLCGK